MRESCRPIFRSPKTSHFSVTYRSTLFLSSVSSDSNNLSKVGSFFAKLQPWEAGQESSRIDLLVDVGLELTDFLPEAYEIPVSTRMIFVQYNICALNEFDIEADDDADARFHMNTAIMKLRLRCVIVNKNLWMKGPPISKHSK